MRTNLIIVRSHGTKEEVLAYRRLRQHDNDLRGQGAARLLHRTRNGESTSGIGFPRGSDVSGNC